MSIGVDVQVTHKCGGICYFLGGGIGGRKELSILLTKVHIEPWSD